MDGESIKPRRKPSPGRVSSPFSPELSVITHPHARGLEQLGDDVQYGGEGGHYGGEFIAKGGKIAIRYKSPGNFNPESVRLDLDDGDSESMASHSSWLDRD